MIRGIICPHSSKRKGKPMKIITAGGIMTLLLLQAFQADVQSQTRNRGDVPERFQWNLADLYPSDADWEKAKTGMVDRFDQVLQFKGKLTGSAGDLLAALDFVSGINREFTRLACYAGMKSDQDTRDSKTMAMRQEISTIGTNWGSRLSFFEPELVQLDISAIDRFISEEPRLKVYRMYLADIQRCKAHKLSEKEERIMAEAGLLADGPSTIYGIFANADFPYPETTLSDGTRIKLDQAGYGRYRQLPDREDRETVFSAFWGAMGQYRRTFGAQLYANIKKDLFYARARGYKSCLAGALDVYNIPEAVYHSLISNVNANLPTFHRYLRLKKRMLGVDTLKYSDLYAPVVKNIDLEYPVEEAEAIICDALNPLGTDYVKTVRRAFSERWIDVYPTAGKQSGAYSNGNAYDVHPYILLNYNGKYQDVSTLAHELGHTIHSHLSNKTQPYPLADYSIFVAEVASTFNEALLNDRMLREIRADGDRLSLLMEYLDNIKGTVFRQTQFAEFELAIHEKAEKDQPLTGDVLTSMYGDILRKYYGHDQGVCRIDDKVTVEWSYIPHFYYNFYVYQYATSFTASVALSEKVLSKEKGALERYLAFLSSGGSDYPIELLKRAGVDMTAPEPFDKTMSVMNRTMDEIEKILDRRGK
jgi:oligoendopeptidase F